METLHKKSWRDQTWVVVFCCFMLIFTGLGFCSSGKSFYMDAVVEAMRIPDTLFALNDTARYVVTAILSLFFAPMVARLGTKKLIAVGFAMLVASQLIYATAPNIYVFWLGSVLLGGGLSFMGNSMASYIIKRRVKKNTGTVLGFVMAANGIGGTVSIQLISYCIDETKGGYKTAYLAVAAILALVAVIVCTLFKEDRETPHSAPAKKKARGQSWEGISYDEGKKKAFFYWTCALVFFTGFTLAGLNGISKKHCVEVGFDNAVLKNIWSAHSFVLMGGKFISGFIYDKKGIRWTLLVGQVAAILVLVALSMAATTSFGTAMVWIYAIFSAVSLPLETIGVSLVAGDIFGTKDFAKFLGIMMAFNSAGFALGTPSMALVFDLTGSYVPAILGGAAVMLVVAVIFQFVVTAAHKERDRVTAE